MSKNPHFLISIHTGQRDLPPPFHPLWAAVSGDGVAVISFGIDLDTFTAEVQNRFPNAEILLSHAPHPALTQIGAYLHGKRQSFDIPLDLRSATPFQRQVYREVIKIPYGETRSYGQIADQFGNPKAARAVGAANGANPLPILIPCHRLVGADGSLRGYGGPGGTVTKQWLLNLEQGSIS